MTPDESIATTASEKVFGEEPGVTVFPAIATACG